MLAAPVARTVEANRIMQYETISVRKELMFSNARLASAKGSRPAATLAPLAGDQLEHEWHRPEVHSELDAVRQLSWTPLAGILQSKI